MSLQVHVMLVSYHWIFSINLLCRKDNSESSRAWSKIIGKHFLWHGFLPSNLSNRLFLFFFPFSTSPPSPLPLSSSSITWLLTLSALPRGCNEKQSERWVIFSVSTLTWFMSNTAPIKQCPDLALVLSPTAGCQTLTYSNIMEAAWHPLGWVMNWPWGYPWDILCSCPALRAF